MFRGSQVNNPGHMRNSGKLLIIAMFLVAFVAAGASWWFRYSATHQAAQFWGPEAAQLIRDAPHVVLLALHPADVAGKDVTGDNSQSSANSPGSAEEFRAGPGVWKVTARHDVSAAPGITHLRNALLEDRSFNWGPLLTDHDRQSINRDDQLTTALVFRDGEKEPSLAILFVPNFVRAIVSGPGSDQPRMIWTQPIAAGLSETINDWSQLPATDR